MTARPPIYLTQQDMNRLRSLLGTAVGKVFAREARALERELSRAHVVAPEEIPPHVATMNSRLIYQDIDTGREREITLVYPWTAVADASKVSVLSPLGTALLGLPVGAAIEWPMPDGTVSRWRLLAVTFQPEAAGEVHL